MAKKVKREKRREQRRQARERQLRRQTQELISKADIDPADDDVLIVDDQDIEEDEFFDEEEPVVEELQQKSYEDEYGYYRPTSFAEVDAMKDVREKEEAVREIGYTVSSLVHNITYSNMTPDEKGKAIASVGNEFPKRVKSIMGEVTEKARDMDLLELEAFMARDTKSLTAIEKVQDWISKAKLTTAAEKKLSDSDFAMVVERDGKKIRKYPIHDKAHVRNALARAAQMIKQGGEGASDAKSALPKIREAAKKMGIGAMEKSSSAVVVEKDLSGSWRAVMWPSNNFIDTDGDILSDSAHREYVEWVNKNMDLAPVFVHWHTSGTQRQNQVDFVGYENGFLLMSAPLTEDEAAVLLKAQSKYDIGMSHGTIVLERDPNDARVVTKYRMVEVSDLPLQNAANPFTDFALICKEAQMDRYEYLVDLLGEDKAKAYIAKSGMKQTALRAVGVEEKEAKEEETPESSKAPASSTPASMQPEIETILKAVEERFDIPGLEAFVRKAQEDAEKIEVLETIIKDLNKSSDDTLAEMIAPKVTAKRAWSQQPTRSSENLLKKDSDEDKKLSESKPEVHWLLKVANVDPVEQ